MNATPGMFRTAPTAALALAAMAALGLGTGLLAFHHWVPGFAVLAVVAAGVEGRVRWQRRAARRDLIADIDASRRRGEPRRP